MLPKPIRTVLDATGAIDVRTDRLTRALIEAGLRPEEAAEEARQTMLRRRQADLEESVDRLTRDYNMGF